MKKLLALVLALIMTMGLMTVSSSAASYPDQDSIVHKEAVDIMTGLGILAGKDTGNFDPTGDVKRSEMAKMVTLARLGTVTNADNFKGAASDLTDIDGTWGEGYIKFCVSEGIVSGKGQGLFKPNDKVTATEAAKMLLVAIGYNADVQGYKGNQWKIAVNRDASLKRFFTGLEGIESDHYLTRDEAAQMVYNAMDATLIHKTSEIKRGSGEVSDIYTDWDDGRDLLSETFKAFTWQGVFTRFGYSEKDAKWTITVVNGIAGNPVSQVDPATVNNGNPAGNVVAAVAANDFDTFEDYSDLYMQQVKVLYQFNKNYSIDKALGVYPIDSSIVTSNTLSNIDVPNPDAKEVKIDSVNYRLTDTAALTPVVVFGYDKAGILAGAGGNIVSSLDTIVSSGFLTKNTTPVNSTDARQAWNFRLIDYTGDDKGDVVLVYPVLIGKVTAVSTSSVTVDYKLSDNGNGASFLRKNVEVYDGIAKDDFVAVTLKDFTTTNVATIEKVETATGAVSSTRGNDKELVDGEWYNSKFLKQAKAGDKITYVAYNGFLLNQDGASTTSADDFVVVIDAATEGTNKLGGALTAKVIKADGTKQTIEVKKVDNIKLNAIGNPAALLAKDRMYVLDFDGDDALLYDVNNTYVYANGTSNRADRQFETGYDAVNFSIAAGTVAAPNDDHIDGTNTIAGADFVVSNGKREAYIRQGGKDFTIADDAVVYVKEVGEDVVRTTGAQFKKNTATTTQVAFYAVEKNSTNGYDEVKLAYVTTGAGGISTKKTFAFTLAAPSIKQDSDGKYYAELKVWNGSEEVILETESKSTVTGIVATANQLENKQAFSYELNASGKVNKINGFSVKGSGFDNAGTGAKAVAITQYKADTLVTVSSLVFYKAANNTLSYVPAATNNPIYSFSYKITDDTEIFFVDLSDGTVGEPNGSVSTASTEYMEGVNEGSGLPNYVANAIVVPGDSAAGGGKASEGDIAKLIVVDLGGDFLGVR